MYKNMGYNICMSYIIIAIALQYELQNEHKFTQNDHLCSTQAMVFGPCKTNKQIFDQIVS